MPLPPRIVRRAGDPASHPKPPMVWVQASSMAGAAVWGGPFLDVNHNGTMEFAPPGQPLPPGSWTPEMNFLGVRSPTGETALGLPAGVKLRFTMQWRESRDPTLPGLDIPAVPVVLRLFRQLDPNGARRPSDEMAEDARSIGGPYPIVRTASYVVFEQILEFTTPVAGHYALVVATGYQPDPLLPALRREVEINPRLIVETLSAKQGESRVVFRSYVTPAAGVGIPADSNGAITVGVPSPGQLTGGGTEVELRAKPELFGPDAVTLGDPPMQGTGIATGFLGGMAAELVQAGAAGANPFLSSGFAMDKLAVVPDRWMRVSAADYQAAEVKHSREARPSGPLGSRECRSSTTRPDRSRKVFNAAWYSRTLGRPSQQLGDWLGVVQHVDRPAARVEQLQLRVDAQARGRSWRGCSHGVSGRSLRPLAQPIGRADDAGRP